MGISTLLQIATVSSVDVGHTPQSDPMEYFSRHPGVIPLHVNVNNSGDTLEMAERVIDSGGGRGPVAKCIPRKTQKQL